MNKIFYLIVLIQIILISCGGEKNNDNAINEKVKTSIDVDKPVSASSVLKLSPQERLGKRLFLLCTACHNLKKGEPHKVGPNLNGIFGAKAGLREGFIYSEALKKSEIVWNEEEMKKWITDPTDFVPGTNMAFIGIEKQKQQDALIAYLKVATQQDD